MAEGFEASHEFTCGSGGMASIKVVVAQIPVGRVGLEHLKGDDQDLMRSGADRPAPIGVCLDPPKEAGGEPFLQWEAAQAACVSTRLRAWLPFRQRVLFFLPALSFSPGTIPAQLAQ